MHRLEQTRERLGRDAHSIMTDLGALTARRDAARAEAEVAFLETDRLAGESARAGNALDQSRLAEQQAKERLAVRLRGLQRSGVQRPLRLVSAGNPESLVAAFRGLTDAAWLDRRAASRAQETERRARWRRERIAQIRMDLAASGEAARLAAESAAEAAAELEGRLQAVRQQEGLFRDAAAEMARAARDLDAFLQGRGSSQPLGPHTRALKGTLPWPASGRILKGFGTVRHPRFGTVLPHRGLAIGAPPGAPVRAVAAGTVLFSDWLKGYGRTVILDHGFGVVTVSSHLSRLDVNAGNRVEQAQVVGAVGDSGTLDGTRLYYEVREGGTPVDPLTWLVPGQELQRR